MSLQPGAMPERSNYWIPTLLMAVMLGCVIYLVTVYPARSYDLTDPDANAYLVERAGDYRVRKPYTDLQWFGREVYKQEGCFYCHSQQTRYQDRGMGPTMIPQEYQWDEPHLLGSARTGPDLAREGGKYPSRWHREHHINPRSKYSGSIMPRFEHVDGRELTFETDEEIDVEELLALSFDELRERVTPEEEIDRKLTPEEVILELRAIGYTNYDLMKFDGRGITHLDALTAYIQSLGPHRMYEPGGRIQEYLPTELPRDEGYALGRREGERAHDDPAPLTTEGPLHTGTKPEQPEQALRAAPGVETNEAVGGRDPLPAGVRAPAEWTGLSAEQQTYWVPTEYQDLANEAREDNKIPAFEPRFIVNGRGIYLGKCAHCHGLNGQGNGPAGRYMMKKPANFWLPQFKDYNDAMWFYRIAEGIPGTEMPVWKLSLRKRKESERWDQIWYLVTYLKYIAAASPMKPVPYDVPPEYYMYDHERSREVTLPVDAEFIEAHKAAMDAAAEARGETPASGGGGH